MENKKNKENVYKAILKKDINSMIVYFIVFSLVWVFSGVMMQYTIVKRIEEKGSYSAWFGDKILIFDNNKK